MGNNEKIKRKETMEGSRTMEGSKERK